MNRIMFRTINVLIALVVTFGSYTNIDATSENSGQSNVATDYWPGNAVTNTGALVAPYIAPPYTCVTNYYVSKTGSNSNNGTSLSSAWLTIPHAISVLKALGGRHGGTCINVGPGTYTKSNSARGLSGSGDTATGYLVFRSTTLHGATVQVPAADATGVFSSSFGFDEAHFIVIDGFNLVGQVVPGSIDNGVSLNSYGKPGDHIKVINNIIHHHGGAGVSAVHTDYLVLEGNVIYNNANTSTFQMSGVTFWQAVASDTAPGFHNVIRNNIVYNNSEVNDGHAEHPDGNGIILDDFRNTQHASPYGVYRQKTLIENNLLFDNGSAGIHIYRSDNVTVRNNTAFSNYIDKRNTGTWRGDINVVNGGNCIFVNNVSVANRLANSYNTAYRDSSTNGSNINNVWVHNLSFNGTPGQASWGASGSPSVFTSANGNILGSDPLFNNPSNADFTLQTGSPAIDAGSSTYGIPADDLAGRTRPVGVAVDMGGYEYTSQAGTPTATPTQTPTPPATVTKRFHSKASQDGWVLESGQTSNVGGSLNSTAPAFRLGDDAAKRQYRSVLSFATSGLPDNAVITSVKLRIRRAGLSGSYPFNTMGNILADIQKGSFSNNPALEVGDFQAASSKDAVMTFTNTPVNGWYAASLSSADYSYVNLTGPTQFRLRFATGNNNNLIADYLIFSSGNYTTTASYQPTLVIQYYVP